MKGKTDYFLKWQKKVAQMGGKYNIKPCSKNASINTFGGVSRD